MSEATRRYRSAIPVSPINFRMPTALRARLRRFAEERNVGEADALRVIVSEHLAEAERERDLSDAERWQLTQVYATLRRRKRGGNRSVSRREIDRAFADALEAAKPNRSK